MQVKHWLVVIVSVLAFAASGCRERNPYNCPGGSECPEPGGPCKASDECAEPTPVCKIESEICVECTENGHCEGDEVCDENICAECTQDAECPSGLCLAEKKCAGVDEVAYVDAAKPSTNLCTKMEPCGDLGKALMLTPAPKYIRATGVLTPGEAITIDKSIIIYGDPRQITKIKRSTPGEVLVLTGMEMSQIDLFDLEIEGNPGAGKDCVRIFGKASVTMTGVDVHGHGENGIRVEMGAKLVAIDSKSYDNRLDGVRALSGATLELRRSDIYNNSSNVSGSMNAGAGDAGVYATNAALVTIESSVITGNAGKSGGVSINGPFTIRNSIIAVNGDLGLTNSAGGLTLNPGTATATAQFEFNTVSDNRSVSGFGMTCTLFPVAVSNSIITGNLAPANCTITHSLLAAGATGSNKNGDPMFINKTFGAPGFFRISSASAAKDSADEAATLNVDIDGDPRNDVRKDMGADEFRP